jgi:uncharacterized delta-60 repeat protein
MGVNILGNTVIKGNAIFGPNPNIIPGLADPSFNIGDGFNALVHSVSVQTDNKILVVGNFTTYSGMSANGIIRLNSDGSKDSSFNTGAGFDSFVLSLSLQTDGKILVGGGFSTYSGISANGLIRLNSDGSKDSSFNIGTGFSKDVINVQIWDIKIQSDNKILVCGAFSTFSGISANNIIRLNSDGSKDNSFVYGTGFNTNFLYALAIQSDGKILAGGTFTTYSGISANRIIRLNSDGSKDSSFNIGAGFNSTVQGLSLQTDEKILVGGTFSTYSGISANGIIRLNSDGSKDNSFVYGTGFANSNFSFRNIIDGSGKIIFMGSYTLYNGVTSNRIIRLNSDGSKDNSFITGVGFNDSTRSGTIQSDGKILVCGNFTTYDGVTVNRLIRLNGN